MSWAQDGHKMGTRWIKYKTPILREHGLPGIWTRVYVLREFLSLQTGGDNLHGQCTKVNKHSSRMVRQNLVYKSRSILMKIRPVSRSLAIVVWPGWTIPVPKSFVCFSSIHWLKFSYSSSKPLPHNVEEWSKGMMRYLSLCEDQLKIASQVHIPCMWCIFVHLHDF